jgi:uncharacterized protein YdaU (DUF1376 family)
MAKPPAAMPLYVQDFLHGTAAMTNEEVGAYSRLLAHEWEHGSVPADDRTQLAALLHESPPRALQLWSRLHRKFRRGDDGQWRNPRCDRERVVAVEFSRQQQDRARKRWQSVRLLLSLLGS